MCALRVFLADDQIPHDDLFEVSDEEMKATLEREHPNWGPGYINGFPRMRDMVGQLRTSYIVEPCNNFQKAKDKILAPDFNAEIAIIDVGWSGDQTAPGPRDIAGFELIKSIEEINKSRKVPIKAFVYSNRIDKEPSIVRDAADLGVLVVKKSFSVDIDANLLKAAIKLATGEKRLDPAHELSLLSQRAEDRIERLRNSVQEQQEKLFLFSLLSGIIILSLLLIGSIAAFFWNLPLGLVSTVAGILSAAAATYFGNQLKESREDVKKIHSDMKEEYDKLRNEFLEKLETP